ncbi:hypothetical protein [Bacteroides sp. 51]|uniref:hypothetical protein n=1 Tax=Bacteroides sp. 51 TaxID=2302938 RepID=UPI0013D2961C|nr:hypothetical protein [Bacteroides sp. 51]NDV81294.1 hypothetical protein [Bacteroides sp. 51]
METNITIKIPEDENLFEAEFSISIVGMKVKNREFLKELPERIKQSWIDCAEMAIGGKLNDKVKDAF